jgi:hypothetical protein
MIHCTQCDKKNDEKSKQNFSDDNMISIMQYCESLTSEFSNQATCLFNNNCIEKNDSKTSIPIVKASTFSINNKDESISFNIASDNLISEIINEIKQNIGYAIVSTRFQNYQEDNTIKRKQYFISSPKIIYCLVNKSISFVIHLNK